MMQHPSKTAPAWNANVIKANFNDIYLQPDPREYYRVLFGLDYIIPDLAKGIFRQLIDTCERKLGRTVRVLDIGCSYGNNAAMIKHSLDIDKLAQRYLSMQASGVSTDQLIELDRHYFRSWPSHDVEFIGLDLSAPALSYARRVGLIDYAIAGNYESDTLAIDDTEALRGVDLIISTGSVGYVTERTFRRILAAVGDPAPWVASFVLRMFPYNKIAETLNEAGLVTEKLTGVTFVQRRFQSENECVETLRRLSEQGIDPQGKEANGLLHAELYISRPAADCVSYPLEQLVSVTKGTSRQFGRRFHRGQDGVVRLMR